VPDEIEADAECPVKGNVYIDREAGIAYDCMLNQSNVGNNNNKYFILQVIENKFNPNSYTTWFRWGRVGYPGQNNITNTDLDTAISLFKKKFKDKTGNVFGSATFTKKAGKYDMIKLDYGKGKSKSSTSIEVKKEEEVESKLCPEVKAAIDLMCDMSIMGRYLKSSLNFDSDKCPLGNISKAQVKAGYELLTKIEAKMLESKFDEEYEDLLNQYYTKIPHNFGFKRPKMIKTLQEFKEELALLEALSDIEITTSAMKEKEESVSIHPSDQNYQRLKCELTPLKKTNPTYKMIETYLKNTKGPTHHQNIKLHNVFEIKRESEAEQYMGYTKSIGNR
jgi:poly [ADP-ribose] polymerase